MTGETSDWKCTWRTGVFGAVLLIRLILLLLWVSKSLHALESRMLAMANLSFTFSMVSRRVLDMREQAFMSARCARIASRTSAWSALALTMWAATKSLRYLRRASPLTP